MQAKYTRQCKNCGKEFVPTRHSAGKFCSRLCAYLYKRTDTPEGFWERVDSSLGPLFCWPWKKSKYGKGYGQISWNGHKDLAHRIAWMLSYGPVPNDMHVLHRCDVRSCCNPSHLFLGTNDDNVADMVAKGRQARGESSSSSKVTAEQVRQIRQQYKEGIVTQEALAKQYNLSRANIGTIVQHKSWKHIV